MLETGFLHMHETQNDAFPLSECYGLYIAGITGRLWKGKHHLSGDSSMSGEEMGTNVCTAEGRGEAKFISITVREYERESTTVAGAH